MNAGSHRDCRRELAIQRVPALLDGRVTPIARQFVPISPENQQQNLQQ